LLAPDAAPAGDLDYVEQGGLDAAALLLRAEGLPALAALGEAVLGVGEHGTGSGAVSSCAQPTPNWVGMPLADGAQFGLASL
jgi:hypothetical protein